MPWEGRSARDCLSVSIFPLTDKHFGDIIKYRNIGPNYCFHLFCRSIRGAASRAALLKEDFAHMKKVIICLALALVLILMICAPVLATDPVISPQATPNVDPGYTPDISPKTADFSTFAFIGAGVVCLCGAFICIRKSRNAA